MAAFTFQHLLSLVERTIEDSRHFKAVCVYLCECEGVCDVILSVRRGKESCTAYLLFSQTQQTTGTPKTIKSIS